MNRPILAQYTVRAKQDYIFRSSRMVEVVGASALIRDAFDLLFDQAAQAGLRCLPLVKADGAFCWQTTQEAFAEGRLQMVELFRGGGNDTVLFDSMDSYRAANRAFTFAVLAECPGMIPLCVGCPATGQYQTDYAALMAAAEREKSRMTPGRDSYALPFAMMDRTVFAPYAATTVKGGEAVRLTAESAAKQRAGLADDKTTEATRWLDDLVTRRGEESLLAIVHADGNNMGKKIAASLSDQTGYDFCVDFMRRFTADTARAFVQAGLQAVAALQAQLLAKDPQHPGRYYYRLIVADGDDVTFLCNARQALRYTTAYLRAVSAFCARPDSDAPAQYSSCAGGCIFHSHYPFARAYELAEQACDNAKRDVHATGREEAWLDFHYIHSGLGGELDALRQRQHTADRMARPWRVCADDEASPCDLCQLDALAACLKAHDVNRLAIKALGAAWESSAEEGYAELERICYRRPALPAALRALYPQRKALLRALYDLYEIYDLWYGREAE